MVKIKAQSANELSQLLRSQSPSAVVISYGVRCDRKEVPLTLDEFAGLSYLGDPLSRTKIEALLGNDAGTSSEEVAKINLKQTICGLSEKLLSMRISLDEVKRIKVMYGVLVNLARKSSYFADVEPASETKGPFWGC